MVNYIVLVLGAWRIEAMDIVYWSDIVGRVQFKDGWRVTVRRQYAPPSLRAWSAASGSNCL